MHEEVPTAVLIGAQKSGTTTVFRTLAGHPKICAPSAAQDIPIYCAADVRAASAQWLAQQLSRCEPGHIRLHGCSHYLYLGRDAASALRAANPAVRLLCILRNPVERAYSAWQYAGRTGREDPGCDFEQAVERELAGRVPPGLRGLEQRYIDHGYYGRQLAEWLEVFPVEQIRVVLYEELRTDPDGVFAELTEFLGVPRIEHLQLRKHNPFAVPRSTALAHLLSNTRAPAAVRRMIPRAVRIRLRRRLHALNARAGVKPDLDARVRDRLDALFAEDRRFLATLVDRDLSHWRGE